MTAHRYVARRKHEYRLARRAELKKRAHKEWIAQRTVTRCEREDGSVEFRYYDPRKKEFVVSSVLPDSVVQGMTPEQISRLRGPKKPPVILTDFAETSRV